MPEPATLVEWFRAEGWVVVLACLTLLLQVRYFFWTRAVKRAVELLEVRYGGLSERVRYAIDKADNSVRQVRRMTEELSPLPTEEPSDPNDATRIRERPEP